MKSILAEMSIVFFILIGICHLPVSTPQPEHTEPSSGTAFIEGYSVIHEP